MARWNQIHTHDPVKNTTREQQLPERLEFRYDPDVVLRGMLIRRATGKTLSPEEIEAIDDEWGDELDRMEHWFDFERAPRLN